MGVETDTYTTIADDDDFHAVLLGECDEEMRLFEETHLNIDFLEGGSSGHERFP